MWLKEKMLVTSIFLVATTVFESTLCLVVCLTLYHTIPTFNDPKEEGFGKHCGKRRKCWKPAFSPFPTVFSTLEQSKIIILTMFNLSSANAFTMVTSKSLSFGKGLSHYQTTDFRLFQTERVCR